MSYDWRNYISVLTPAASGTLIFSVETYDASPNVTLTLPVTAGRSMDEISLANQISNQFTTLLTQACAIYQGIPVFSFFPPNANFYVDKTDHVVSFWSQAQYRLQLVSNTTGAAIQISPTPTLLTLAQAKSMAPLVGVDFSDFNENDLTDNQIMELLQIASNQIVNIVNNPIIIANHLLEIIGNMVGSVKLDSKPVLDYDPPVINRPSVLLPLSLPILQSGYSYDIVRNKGIFNYRYDSNLINAWDPYDSNNEVRMTYRAGNLNIPRIIQEKVIQVAGISLNTSSIKSLKGGSASVEFRLPQEALAAISAELAQFRIR